MRMSELGDVPIRIVSQIDIAIANTQTLQQKVKLHVLWRGSRRNHSICSL